MSFFRSRALAMMLFGLATFLILASLAIMLYIYAKQQAAL